MNPAGLWGLGSPRNLRQKEGVWVRETDHQKQYSRAEPSMGVSELGPVTTRVVWGATAGTDQGTKSQIPGRRGGELQVGP